MKVSVIIPSVRLKYLDETFESLYNQTVQPYEILLSHNQDTDPSEKVNKLAAIAKGDAILVLSDDDKLDSRYIEDTASIMDETGVDIVYTDMIKFGMVDEKHNAPSWNFDNFKKSTVPYITSLVRKSMFDKVGGWDKDQIYQDYDFWYRCFKEGATAYHLERPYFIYRVHEKAGSFMIDPIDARMRVLNKHPELK